MSDLLNVLTSEEESIRPALEEKLSNQQSAASRQLRPLDSVTLYDTLLQCCRTDQSDPARQWAATLRDEAGSGGVPCAEVLTSLHCLERVVRYYVIRSISQKKALVPALAELSDRVDLMRRCCAEGMTIRREDESVRAEHFLAMAESATFLICLATLHGKPFYLNPAGRRMIGLAEDDPLPATSLHRYYSQQSWDQLRDVAVPAVQESGRWDGRSELCNLASGEQLEVNTSLFLVRTADSEKASCLAIIHRDAADFNEVEERLVEAEARKRSILESSLDPIITIDHRGVITEFNRAAEQTFGHSRDKVLGTQPSEVLFPESSSEGEQNRIERYLDAGEGSLLGRRTEVTAVRASGESFPAEIAMTISQEQGDPVLTFFVRDISSRKKAEQEQERYAAELERSNQELEQFAYVASHDLQEPLRKIRTFSDRLEVKSGEMLDDEGRQCVARMQSAAERMQTLIEGLLRLSRITTRGQEFTKVDLNEVVAEVVSDLENQIDRVEGRVDVESLPTIQADRVQMRQLLQNLIGNALKFHRVDEPPLVKVHARFVRGGGNSRAGRSPRDERCRLVVEDNGIGMEEKYLERIFGVFQRLHPRDIYEGTGIGLAVCRKIVERHGGTITASSQPGHGSTFEVLVPITHRKEKH